MATNNNNAGARGRRQEAHDIVRCQICFDTYRDPRILPCLHSFCSQCLSSLVDINASPTKHFNCPVCRESIPLPPQGVAGFRHDFRAVQLQDFLDQHESLTNTTQSECQFCSAENIRKSSRYYCHECQKLMCESCTNLHVSKTIFKDHVIMDTRRIETIMQEVCETHEEEKIRFLCRTCNTAACTLCAMSTVHRDHELTDITTGLHEYTTDFMTSYNALLRRSSVYQAKLTSLAEAEENTRYLHMITARAIKRRTDAMREHMQQQEKRMLHDLDRLVNKELAEIQEDEEGLQQAASQMRSITKMCGTMVLTPVAVSTISLYSNLCSRMEALLLENATVSPISNVRREWNFVPSSSKIRVGKLIGIGRAEEPSGVLLEDKQQECNNPWRLKAKIGGYGRSGGQFDSPRDVAFLRDGSFVVADSNNNRLQVFTCDGLLITVIGEGQIKPWGVCLTPEGHLATTDNLEKCIKVFRLDGTSVAKFGKFLCPCGIAVTRRGDFVVTDFFSTFSYILRRCGKIIRQFEIRTDSEQHSCGASRVAVDHHDNIVISDVSNACVKVFDSKGNVLLRTSLEDELIAPQGVCQDMQGRFLVADAIRENVAILSPNGKFLGRFMEGGNQLNDVTGIAISPDGAHMVVTLLKSNTVMIYVNHTR